MEKTGTVLDEYDHIDRPHLLVREILRESFLQDVILAHGEYEWF